MVEFLAVVILHENPTHMFVFGGKLVVLLCEVDERTQKNACKAGGQDQREHLYLRVSVSFSSGCKIHQL